MTQVNYYRGDGYPLLLTVTDSGTGNPVDITNYTFLLTVNKEEAPIDDSRQVFQAAGTIVDGPNGQVSFPVVPANTAEVGDYFYDVQMTTVGGDVRTIAKDAFIVSMDITK
jgi:hypothetical protein